MIPLSIPFLNGNELKYVKDCIETGWVSSAGSYVTEFEKSVAEFSGSKYAIAAVNGTSGLHLAMHVLDVCHGDIVIVPNITFIASANAVVYTNAKPVFIDIDPNTWQMDLDLLEEFLQTKTEMRDGKCYIKDGSAPVSAIMPVHVLGNMCNMDRLMSIAKKRNIKVVEDASESLGSYYKGRHSGTWGDMSVFSFNGNKIITTGGGGILISDNEELSKRAKHLSTQSKVNPETYFHDEIGFNYRLVNVLAAIGVAQMEQLPEFILKKKKMDHFYRSNLNGVGDITFQKVYDEVDPNCWLFTFYSTKKDEILRVLKENKVVARPFWTPMNQLPMFQDALYINKNDYSKDIHLNCLSIPSSTQISENQQERVVKLIKSVF